VANREGGEIGKKGWEGVGREGKGKRELGRKRGR